MTLKMGQADGLLVALESHYKASADVTPSRSGVKHLFFKNNLFFH